MDGGGCIAGMQEIEELPVAFGWFGHPALVGAITRLSRCQRGSSTKSVFEVALKRWTSGGLSLARALSLS